MRIDRQSASIERSWWSVGISLSLYITATPSLTSFVPLRMCRSSIRVGGSAQCRLSTTRSTLRSVASALSVAVTASKNR